jgi:hypothetical protein
MATKRRSLPLRSNSSEGLPKATRRTYAADPLADLHAYRRQLAARFHYDAAKLGAYFDSVSIPPGIRVVDLPAKKRQATRKSA